MNREEKFVNFIWSSNDSVEFFNTNFVQPDDESDDEEPNSFVREPRKPKHPSGSSEISLEIEQYELVTL